MKILAFLFVLFFSTSSFACSLLPDKKGTIPCTEHLELELKDLEKKAKAKETLKREKLCKKIIYFIDVENIKADNKFAYNYCKSLIKQDNPTYN